ncbi:MAG: DMT family transporter [Pasteurellaceae bacterium]|nr:DMT family transporter [Pasteurellaceae bacterium]
MIQKNKLGISLGLLSGLLWAIYLFLLDRSYSETVYSIFFSSLILFLLNEFFALIWLTLVYRGKNISGLLPHRNTIGKRWWFFSISPIGTLFYILAIIIADSVTVSVVSSIYPILAVFLTRLILDRKITLFHYFLAMLSFSGILLFSLNGLTDINVNFYGVLFSLICAFCWAGESILCRYYAEVNIDTDLLLSVKYIVSVIIGILIFFIYLFNNPSINLSLIFEYKWLFFIAIISLLSYLFYYRAIGTIGSVYALNLNITYVFWTIVFTALSTGVSIYSILGSAAILLSIFLISTQKDNV